MVTGTNRTEKILFSLLRMALHNTVETNIDWKSVTEEEWKQCYRLAALHGVMAVAWDGIQYIEQGRVLPRSLKLSWGLAVQNYEDQYDRFCQVVSELSDIFSQQGIEMVQIKGVGLSTYYPVPSHREGGDIDIYTYSSNRNLYTDKEANHKADEVMRSLGIEVDDTHPKHSNFMYRGISVENHRVFLNVHLYDVAKSMNQLLMELLKPQSVSLCEGKYKVNVPPPIFNCLYLPFHAAQHYGEGIKIHHLFDIACLIKQEGWQLSSKVTDPRLLNFIHSLVSLCRQLFNLDIQVEDNKLYTEEIYRHMMHPQYSNKVPVKGKIMVLGYKIRRTLHSYRKLKTIFRFTFFRWIGNSIIYHLRKPRSIFQ